MSQIVKAFTGLIMMMFLMLTAIGVLGLFTDTISAHNLHSAMIDELENSHYAKAVLEDCFSSAETNAYQLEIILYSTESGRIVCKSKSQIPQSTEGVYMAEVVLAYGLESPFFYLNQQQEIAGYAR